MTAPTPGPCGCSAEAYPLGSPRSRIIYCPLHAAAPAMAEALKTTEAEIVTLKARLSGPYARNMEALLVDVRAAIAKTEGRQA